jgi:hypothetical protein
MSGLNFPNSIKKLGVLTTVLGYCFISSKNFGLLLSSLTMLFVSKGSAKVQQIFIRATFANIFFQNYISLKSYPRKRGAKIQFFFIPATPAEKYF